MKRVVDRQSSALVGRNAGSLSPSPSAAIPVRDAKRVSHWLFAAYVALAAVVIPYDLVQARHFAAALARLRSCVARADSGCANVELSTARKIRPADERLEIAEASLAVLLHQVARAEANARVLENRDKRASTALDSEIRADLLLLRGDLAWAKGNHTEARDDFTAALPLLSDPSLVATRLQRIDAREKAARDQNATELEALRQDFSELFAAAAQGSRELFDLRAAKTQSWVGRASHSEVRQALSLALDAARRAESAIETENRALQAPGLREPQPPVRGTTNYSVGYLGSYDSQLALYRQRLERYNQERAETESRQAQRSAKATETSNAALAQARALLDDALRLQQASSIPLRDAVVPPIATQAPAQLVRPVVGPVFVE
jgi:hypothetical protein